jgi:hypothetical protein
VTLEAEDTGSEQRGACPEGLQKSFFLLISLLT